MRPEPRDSALDWCGLLHFVLFATTTVNITWSFSSRHIRPPPWTSPLLQELSSPLTRSEGTLLCNFQGLWDKIILLCSNLFYKLEQVKLRVERPPTVPEADVSPDPAFSIPLLFLSYFYPSCSFSVSHFSFFGIPTSLFQTAILFRQGSEVKSSRPPPRQKSSFENSAAVHSYCDKSRRCQQLSGLTSSQML